MKDDNFIFLLLTGIYIFTFWLICYQIELRWRPVARIKCKFGYHKRKFKRLGQDVSSYRCEVCGKAKDHPHLKVIDGGKKDFDVPFRF
jgi:hypothetical protein